MHSTAACSASQTRSFSSRRETWRCPPSSVRICSSAAAFSTKPECCRTTARGAELSSMGGNAVLGLLFDTVSSVKGFVGVFIYVYILLILAYVISGWVRMPYSPWLNRIQRFLYDVCDPYLRLWRRILPSFGPLDLSPVIGVAFLYILLAVLTSIANRLH